jgi:hypothetical protein
MLGNDLLNAIVINGVMFMGYYVTHCLLGGIAEYYGKPMPSIRAVQEHKQHFPIFIVTCLLTPIIVQALLQGSNQFWGALTIGGLLRSFEIYRFIRQNRLWQRPELPLDDKL